MIFTAKPNLAKSYYKIFIVAIDIVELVGISIDNYKEVCSMNVFDTKVP